MGTLLNGAEQKFFDSIAVEVMTLAGTSDPVLWKFFKILPQSVLSSVSGQIDCLYKDPAVGSKHYVAYKNGFMVFFEKPDALAEATDTGLQDRFESRMWVVRKNCEDLKIPLDSDFNHMSVGDIIQLWSKNKIRTWYFEVIRVERDGFENDSDVFTHYACDVIRNDSFTPERKVSP